VARSTLGTRGRYRLSVEAGRDVSCTTMTQTSHEALARRARSGDRRALAQIISLIEAGEAPPSPDSPRRGGLVVGLAGGVGAGKSTLAAALVRYLRQQGKRVAVLASDPSSPRTGGALLGDRVRLRIDPRDEGVYFRSLATRGAAGGLSAAVAPARDWLLECGFDVVLVETVGVGQDQVAIRNIVDLLLVLITPHSGDEIQWEKAGLLELADLVVVNKSDLPGAEHVYQQVCRALSLGTQGPAVISVSALHGQGIAELWAALIARQRDANQQTEGASDSPAG